MTKEVAVTEFYFDFLDGIRRKGEINMMEAPRVLQQYFGLDRKAASEVFWKWVDQFEGTLVKKDET